MYSALDNLAVGQMSDGTFLAYIVALVISGLAVIVVAALPLGTSAGMRILNVVLGLAMLGYAFYLFFILQGGTVHIFFYVFVLPILLIWRTVQGWRANRAARRAQQIPGVPTPPAPGQPAPAPQPAQIYGQSPAQPAPTSIPATTPQGAAANE
jgi:hypothetical protein